MAIDLTRIDEWRTLAASIAELAAKLETRRINHTDDGLVEAVSVAILAARAFSTEVVPALLADREKLQRELGELRESNVDRATELAWARNDASMARAALAAARGQELLAFLAEYDEARGRAARLEEEVRRLRAERGATAQPPGGG
jgi:hypothetical protein